MKQYETVIGLEVHVELATKTKIFCGCSTEFGGAPNTHTCPVCTGMPGSLPVLNKKVVEFALKAGLAANCQIHQYCKFDRKNYFYPDNPQNYQISQLYLPICHDGWVEIETSAGKKKIRIHEMHMEEDAGKLIHDEWEDCSLVDYNRSGVPLIEIVSEPDMRSSEEVIAYLEKLRCMMQYLGVSDCKLQEGSMRADVNLSVREVGAEEFGTRTEMKNLNSFKAITHAIEGERERQIELLEEGKEVSMMISGSSMNPFLIHQRDYILMRKPERELKVGDMVFFQRNDGAYVMHRIHHINKKEKLFIIGDAQTEMEGPIDKEQVFAIIIKVKRKGKWISPGDFWWEFFEHIWLHLIPFRRILMKLYGIRR